MIIVKLMGGLGNQMFQYACGRHLSITRNVPLKVDLSFYNNQASINIDRRQFELNIFDINVNVASHSEINIFFPKMTSDLFIEFQKRITRKLNQCLVVNEASLSFNPSYFTKTTKWIYLSGYWQSEKYFSNSISSLVKEFKFKKKPDGLNLDILNSVRHSNSVAVHVRRGDFGKNPHHGMLSIDYYLKSIQYMKDCLKDPVFYFFSDDINWAMQNLTGVERSVFIGHNKGAQSFEDMRLMSNCKHNIIANSSFSWWSAWLNQNKDKVVIAPRTWYHDKELNDQTNDLLPESWIRI